MLRTCGLKLFVLLVLAGFPATGVARTVTQIIFGHTLAAPYGIAVDSSGNAYVAGRGNDHAFKIELCDMLADYPLFEACLTGPGGVADPGCTCPDDDADGDVDLADVARFQLTFVGP